MRKGEFMTVEMIIQLAVIGYTFVVMAVAATLDIRTRKIPNWLTFAAAVTGLFFTYFIDWREGIVRTIAITAVFFAGATGCLGLGDLKLFMALTALQGLLPSLISIFIASCSLLIVKVIKGRYAVDMRRLKDSDKAAEGEKVPFAPYMLLGYCAYLAYFVIDTLV